MRKRTLHAGGLWGSLLLAGVLSGCATVGAKFPVAPVDSIAIGQTTRTDIQRMFGNPWRIGVEDGKTTWTYGHYRYKLFGRAKTRDLVVRFDERSSLGLVRLRVKKAAAELNGVFDSIMQKVEAEKASSGASFESPFAEITDEDIDSLFSE